MIIALLLFNCLLCCFWKSIKIAIALIDATADFFAATKRIIFVSLVYFVVTIVVFIVWMAGMACITSLNTITVDMTTLQGKDIEWSAKVNWMYLFMLIGLIWIVFFIQDKTGFICMVSASTYYFSSSAEKEGSASVFTGIKFAYFKHAGSLAFGSMIHTIVFVIRMIVEIAADQLEKGSQANCLMKCILCCARCCVRCFEDIVEYLNKCAYSYMAVAGDSYCTSAWNGFLLNLKHTAKFQFATVLANIFIFMGKLMIMCLNCATLYLVMKYITKDVDSVSSVWNPIIIIAISSFVTATIFLGLFDEATIATITCMAIDQDLNEGTPKFGPPSFHTKMAAIYNDGHHSQAVKYQKVHQEMGNHAKINGSSNTGTTNQRNEMV